LSHSGKLFANVYTCSFSHAALWFNQQGVTSGSRGRNSTGAESLWGRWNTARAPNDCGGTKKSQQRHKHFLQNSTFASERLRFEHGGAKLASCPGSHLSSLRPYQSGD